MERSRHFQAAREYAPWLKAHSEAVMLKSLRSCLAERNRPYRPGTDIFPEEPCKGNFGGTAEGPLSSNKLEEGFFYVKVFYQDNDRMVVVYISKTKWIMIKDKQTLKCGKEVAIWL